MGCLTKNNTITLDRVGVNKLRDILTRHTFCTLTFEQDAKSGIGVSVSVIANGFRYDITNYENW